MIKGTIITVLSSNEAEAIKLAELMGKRSEERIYYRKRDDLVKSILVPPVNRIIDEAVALSISTAFYLKVPGELTWIDGELALLAEASGLRGVVLPNNADSFRRIFRELRISNYVSEFTEVNADAEDVGVVYVDRAFNVKGVGLVVLGFALTQVSVHDKLMALPMGKEVEVRSIQVLDEDQDSVLPGTRVGLALRNARLEEIEGIQALIKPGIKLTSEVKDYVKLKYAHDAELVHVIACGVRAMGKINGSVISLKDKLPTNCRALIINVNARPKTPRIYGYADLKG
ncbi:translation elongation factor [Caldivirga sp. UBA161]|uniref:translation elongation factor n=1 Tax=Caldivirga sp. UBA161 TaxID=1915569 RepID=UPI0025BA52D6|nr:translation elongation factor [Caldivirga sp. UBA161]